MRVRIYDFPTNDLGAEVFRCESDLRDVYDAEDYEFGAALGYLERDGRYWGGGGAAPLFILRRVREG